LKVVLAGILAEWDSSRWTPEALVDYSSAYGHGHSEVSVMITKVIDSFKTLLVGEHLKVNTGGSADTDSVVQRDGSDPADGEGSATAISIRVPIHMIPKAFLFADMMQKKFECMGAVETLVRGDVKFNVIVEKFERAKSMVTAAVDFYTICNDVKVAVRDFTYMTSKAAEFLVIAKDVLTKTVIDHIEATMKAALEGPRMLFENDMADDLNPAEKIFLETNEIDEEAKKRLIEATKTSTAKKLFKAFKIQQTLMNRFDKLVDLALNVPPHDVMKAKIKDIKDAHEPTLLKLRNVYAANSIVQACYRPLGPDEKRSALAEAAKQQVDQAGKIMIDPKLQLLVQTVAQNEAA
jgi:hypothetical protein